MTETLPQIQPSTAGLAQEGQPRRYFIQTYGCQMNEYDSGKMAELLAARHYLPTQSEAEADLILINTCSVRSNPENKVYSYLGRLAELKAQRPGMVIGVAGCVAQQEGDKILRRNLGVDLVVGTDNLFALPEMLDAVERGRRVVETGWREGKAKVADFIPPAQLAGLEGWLPSPGTRGQVAIMKGCNNFCAFCIVPFTRGREVSRTVESVVEEVARLAQGGAKEVMLLGQNVNSYRAGEEGFVALLEKVHQVEGIERIRYTSPHPKDFGPDLMAAHRGLPKLCPQVHLPFQAGSDRILKAMRRGHTIASYLEKVERARQLIPGLMLSTDIIVGFPGETEEDFLATCRVVEQVGFEHLYAFKFSGRDKTPAAAMAGQLPEEVKAERLNRLLALHDENLLRLHQSLVGSLQQVLVEGNHPREANAVSGRTAGNKSMTVRDCSAPVGSLVQVRVEEARRYSLAGRAL